jgi:hypothetical protein
MKDARIEELECPLDYSIWQTILLLAIAGCVIAPGWIVDGSKRAINAVVPGANLQVDPEPLQVNNAGGLVGAAAAALPAISQNSNDASFDSAFKFARKWEGGYADVAGDAGGKTYGGITEATARRNGISDPRQLQGNEGGIKAIYKKDYWDAAKCFRFKSLVAATTCMDTAINYGSAFLKYDFFAKCPESDEQQWAKCMVKERRAQRYRQAARPSQYKFLAGWLNRDKGLEQFIKGGK